jgi:tRNA (cytidine/uridine-2'-O-)-methyltransferase
VFDIVLCQPEIPPNAGNVIRLCANAGARLHLIEPLGFSMDDKQLKRAGLDYHEMVDVRVHRDWAGCAALLGPRRFALTTRAARSHADTRFEPGDALVFGPEAEGLADAFVATFPPAARLRIPMIPGNRSLNLSNAVAVVVYEAWRQNGFAGAGPNDAENR